ncbi:TRAP transporter small permease subunit [Nitratireductor mangrovi]|uniref:TRAP transporter small permease protein n=1 Tax=Nitratireductor mangrovi TaxID=2599600 RepID=A0A5B8L1I1_9HYPH|nr:TRAP transporter small permease subunit [Nitratireductor mangrovi]QDZ01378.1 TRAP transporter small permease subunit [Nitratireductor mangrovi]
MAGLLALSRIVDRINEFIGQKVSWLILVAVLISAGNASIRKAFDISSNAFLELQWYLYGTVFMLAAAYTLQRNEHVRIDILSNRLSKRTRDWVDLVCHVIFLLPFVTLMVYLCWPWFWLSYRTGEISANAGGLIIWPAKMMVLLGFMLLTGQALSEIVKRIAVIRGDIDDPTPTHDLPAAAEAAIEMETKNRD